MHWASLLAGALCFALLLTACPSDKPRVGIGELGKGDLRILCSVDDAVCKPGEDSIEASVPIAVGASFGVSYIGPVPKAASGNPSSVLIFSGSSVMLSMSDDQFVAWEPGIAAVLARTDQGTVLDFTHMLLVDVDRIELTSSRVVLTVGQEQTWQASPFGPEVVVSDGVLAGSLGYLWEVDGSAVELVETEGRSATVFAKEPGEATLRAILDTAVGQAVIVVGEGWEGGEEP